MIQHTLTVKMTTALSKRQDHLHQDDHAQPSYGTTKSCTVYLLWGEN